MDSGIVNLIVIGIVLVLIIVVKQKYQYLPDENFVGMVPRTSIGNNVDQVYNVHGVYPTGQPMVYPMQLYQSKVPYYDDSMSNVGRPCNRPDGCGIFGSCSGGKCTIKDQTNTVFDIKI